MCRIIWSFPCGFLARNQQLCGSAEPQKGDIQRGSLAQSRRAIDSDIAHSAGAW